MTPSRRDERARLAQTGEASPYQPEYIRTVAVSWGLSERALMALLSIEGRWRTFAVNVLGRQARLGEFFAYRVGAFDGVGVGGMRPALAAAVLQRHFHRSITTGDAAKRLIRDDAFAIELAAAYLHELKDDFGLTNREAYVAYAFGVSRIRTMQARGFNYYGNARNRLEEY